MGRWIRVDVSRQHHPRAVIAGGWGGVVAEAVWEICKMYDKPGVLPARCWNAEFLASWTHFREERGGVAGIKRGMDRAVEAGLLEVMADGSVRIHDWDQHQMDRTAGERNRRARRKDNGELDGCDTGRYGAIRDDTGRHGATSHGSPPQTPPLTGQDGTARAPVDLEGTILVVWSGLHMDRWHVPAKPDIDPDRDRKRARAIIGRINAVAESHGHQLKDEEVVEGWRWAAERALGTLPKSKTSLAYVEATIDRWLTCEPGESDDPGTETYNPHGDYGDPP